MCNKMYENVKSLDYTKKFLQSDSDPATMEVVTQTNAVKPVGDMDNLWLELPWWFI